MGPKMPVSFVYVGTWVRTGVSGATRFAVLFAVSLARAGLDQCDIRHSRTRHGREIELKLHRFPRASVPKRVTEQTARAPHVILTAQ